jgi:hypothetical protein
MMLDEQALKSEKLRMTEVLLAGALPLVYTKESYKTACDRAKIFTFPESWL